MGRWVVYRCQRLQRQQRWRGDGDGSRGSRSGVNGRMAEGAQGERRWSKGVHWGVRLRAQEAVRRWDLLRWCFRLSQA